MSMTRPFFKVEAALKDITRLRSYRLHEAEKDEKQAESSSSHHFRRIPASKKKQQLDLNKVNCAVHDLICPDIENPHIHKKR